MAFLEGTDRRHKGPYLGKSHKEQLVIGEPDSRQLLLFPVSPQPCFVSLGE